MGFFLLLCSVDLDYKNEEIDINNDELVDHLYKTTMEKLSIDQPNYSGYLAEKK